MILVPMFETTCLFTSFAAFEVLCFWNNRCKNTSINLSFPDIVWCLQCVSNLPVHETLALFTRRLLPSPEPPSCLPKSTSMEPHRRLARVPARPFHRFFFLHLVAIWLDLWILHFLGNSDSCPLDPQQVIFFAEGSRQQPSKVGPFSDFTESTPPEHETSILPFPKKVTGQKGPDSSDAPGWCPHEAGRLFPSSLQNHSEITHKK